MLQLSLKWRLKKQKMALAHIRPVRFPTSEICIFSLCVFMIKAGNRSYPVKWSVYDGFLMRIVAIFYIFKCFLHQMPNYFHVTTPLTTQVIISKDYLEGIKFRGLLGFSLQTSSHGRITLSLRMKWFQL